MSAKKGIAPSKSRGGGHGTAAGIDFQAKVGALFAAAMLAETPLMGLPGGAIRSVRFETEAPLDDIMVETKGGFTFIQAKTTLNLAGGSAAPLYKVADQIVRQWLACASGDASRGWNRPLLPDQDAFVIAIGPLSPATVTRDLI